MKGAIRPQVALGLSILGIVGGLLIIKPALAQVASSSSESTGISSSTDANPLAAASSIEADQLASSTNSDISNQGTSATSSDSSTEQASSTPADAAAVIGTSTEPAPAGLTLVHIIGTKYIDYFTDGTTTTAFPGDPNIDANLAKPDAAIPAHAALTWVHTTGQNLYDTPSGDLEVGEAALQPDGSYTANPLPFVSSTSTSSVDAATSPSSSVLSASTTTNIPAPENTSSSDEGSSSTPATPDASTTQPTAATSASSSSTEPSATNTPAE